MTTQRMNRFTMTCDTYHIDDKMLDMIKHQIDEYLDINANELLEDNLVTFIESLDVKYNKERLCFSDSYCYVICDIDIRNITFKDEFEVKQFKDCVWNYIIYYLLLKYNQYVIDQLVPDYINLKED